MKFFIDAVNVIYHIAVSISCHRMHKDHRNDKQAEKENKSVQHNPLIEHAVGKDTPNIIGINGLKYAKRGLTADDCPKSLLLAGNIIETQPNFFDIFMHTVQFCGAHDLSADFINGIIAGLRVHTKQGEYKGKFIFLRHFHNTDGGHSHLNDKIPVNTPQS